MKTMASTIVCLLLATTGRADDGGQTYASRYQEWLPHLSNTLVVTMNVGETSRGLSSGSFSAHLLLREPDAERPNGTRITGHAVVTVQEMKMMLKLIDEAGSNANFSTCEDGNWREPQGAPTRAQVVWMPKEQGHTYDWFVLSQVRMTDLLQKLSGSLRSKEAVAVIEGLIEGNNTRREADQKKANKPSEATR